MLRFLTVLLLLVCAPAYAFDRAKADQFFDILESNDRLRGSVTLLKDGAPVYSRAFGYGNEATTRHRSGSITKVFTAVMIYQLIEEGKLTLDTKLSRFFPRIANAERITIAHLLCHCSGIPSLPQREPWTFEPQTKAQMLARFAALKPEYAPGEKSTYSNPGYILLGYIIEAVTRSTYATQLEQRITRKLGLQHTRFGGPSAFSYAWDDNKWTPEPLEHPTSPAGAGAIVSTSAELATFMDAVFTHKLLTKESVTEMLTPYSKDLPGSEKGIVVFTVRDLDKTAYQHLGGVDAFSSSLTYLPADGLSMAIVFNGQNYPMGKVFRFLLDNYYGRPTTLPSFTPVALPEATLAQYEGTYVFPQINMTITIRRDGPRITAQASGQDAFPLEPVSETLFSHKPSGILIEFRSPTQFSLFQGRGEMRFTRQ